MLELRPLMRTGLGIANQLRCVKVIMIRSWRILVFGGAEPRTVADKVTA